MKRLMALLMCSLLLPLVSGCGKSTPRAEGSQFNGDIRDTKSGFKDK